jgi:hypothetical protein
MTTRERVARAIQVAFIVPAAHTAVLDGTKQAELYEVFHTRPLARWGHALFTPIANVALLALASQVTIEVASGEGSVAIQGSIAAAVITLLFYLAVHGVWAIAMAIPLGLALVAAHGLAGLLGESAALGSLAIALGAALCQTFTHLPEPVPPPWSGRYAFVPVREMISKWRIGELALLALASLVVYPVLELWAAPRIWPVQMLQVLGEIPWLRERTARYRERVRAIHEDARVGWSVPPMSGDEA